MNPASTLRRIVEVLETTGIPYMVTGSFASSYHGVPRASHDIDIVAAPDEEQIRRLVGRLPSKEYFVDLDSALDALACESMFNIIDLTTGWKVDVIIRKSRDFSRREFDRRIPARLFGLDIVLASQEDVVLSKLEWAKQGRSERQIEDVAAVLKRCWGTLDQDYLLEWILDLGLQAEWESARRRAGLE